MRSLTSMSAPMMNLLYLYQNIALCRHRSIPYSCPCGHRRPWPNCPATRTQTFRAHSDPGEGAMTLSRRKFLDMAVGAAATLPMTRIARAQAYPSRPVRLVVPTPAGGNVDVLARLISHWLTERLGQPFVVDNRPGASGTIGTEAVVKAPADGYTLLLIFSANAVTASLYDKLSYNFMRDIVPIAAISREPQIILVNPSVPAK